MKTATKTIAVIDGNSLLHRAYHAVPPTMTAPDGRPTNACFGFISMLIKLITDFSPDGVICAFDQGKPAFRTEALERYKAQRPPIEEELKTQFPMIKELLEAMAIPVVQLQGWEGDDILGTVARMGEEKDKRMLLVTGDRDALQLASDNTSIVTTKKGISDVIVYGPAEVLERYGITPEQVPDYLGLKGDTSDNIPGIHGIGEKTAARLIQQYGSLDSVIEHADEIKGKMGENIREGVESALVSRTVATISRDVPISCNLDSVQFPEFDPDEVRRAFGELKFTVHLAKVLAFSGEKSETSIVGRAGGQSPLIIEPLLKGVDARVLVDAAIARDEWVGVALDDGAGASLFGDTKELFVATLNGIAAFSADDITAVLAHLVSHAKIAALDCKKLLGEVVPPDTACKASVIAAEIDPNRIFDAAIAAYLLDSSRNDYELPMFFDTFLGVSMPETGEGLSVGALSAATARLLQPMLSDAMKKDGSNRCFSEIEMPLVEVLLDMERVGVWLDVPTLAAIAKSTGAEIDRLSGEIFEAAGEEFNIDSSKQLGAILFEKLGLPAKKKTKTGFSTNASVLSELAGLHPLPAKVLEYRELAKIKSTYIDALPRMLGDDRRLHTSYNQTVTATGRLSSSSPNLQNIPVRTDFGRKIRTAFSAQSPDELILSADYSQIELRLLAHLSGDEGLIEAFADGRDFHAATAARVFGVSREDVTPQLRSRAKAVNFGIVYGQQAYGLGQSLAIGYGEAQEMIDRYFAAYPRVREFLDETVADARNKGWVSTLFGRKRHILEIHSTNQNLRAFGERTAMNHPMQGSAADIIKLAMIEVAQRLRSEGFSARMILQVHDELDFECPVDEVEALSAMASSVMSSVVDLRVPLDVSVSTGRTWADAK